MSRRRYLLGCVGCCNPDTKDGPQTTANSVPDGEYLLPGGEWDPSRSNSTGSNRSSRSTRSNWSARLRRSKSDRSSDIVSDGNYSPPPFVPHSKKLPTFEDFRLLKTVGKGAFGKVLLCVHNPTKILYAMKVVPKSKISTQKQINQILAECRILQRTEHPFCVSLQYAFQNDNYLFYVFEFAAGGMLFYHLKQEGRFNEPRARFYFGEIILALDYLHSFGIVFRDLKPENCMLSELGHIVLTDFGSAKMLEVSEKTTTIAGTPQYIAPEVLRGEPYGFSADWWSCGILLYEMLTGKTPFFSPDRLELYKMVLRGEFKVPKYVSPRARALLYRLINRDPDFRIGCSSGACHTRSATEIKEHPFFSQIPMDPDEEAQYVTEEAERERHWDALERSKRYVPSGGSLLDTAGSFIRTFSASTSRRLSGNRPPYHGVQCEWTWEELEAREVIPPFKPRLTSPTDLRHFDPMLTALPPTITDLVSTDRALYLEGFDFVAVNNFDYTEEEKNTPNEAPPDKDGDAPSNQVKVEVEVHSSEENGITSTGD